MHRIIAVGAAGALLASGAAFAQTPQVPEHGWYFGGDVGQSRGPSGGDIDGSFRNQGIATTGTSVKKTDTAWGLNLGYRLNRNWALEGGYRGLGKFGYNTSSAGGGSINGDYKAHAWSFSGLGFLPLGASAWSLYGKLGVARTNVDRDVNSQTAGIAAVNASANRTGLLAGLGVNYDFASNWYGRLGWDHYDRVGDGNTGRTSIDVIGAGIGVRF